MKREVVEVYVIVLARCSDDFDPADSLGTIESSVHECPASHERQVCLRVRSVRVEDLDTIGRGSPPVPELNLGDRASSYWGWQVLL